MGLRTLQDCDSDRVVWYCSTSMMAFGPVFESQEQADQFEKWIRETKRNDPRLFNDYDIVRFWDEFREENS